MIWTVFKIMVLRLWNNPVELGLVFIVPVLFFSIFAAIFSRGIATSKDKKLRVGWVEVTKNDTTDGLLKTLVENDSMDCFRFDDVPDDAAATNLAEEKMRTGKFDLIVRVPADFELVNEEKADEDETTESKNDTPTPEMILVTDGQNPMAEAMVRSVIKGYITKIGGEQWAKSIPDHIEMPEPVDIEQIKQELLESMTPKIDGPPVAKTAIVPMPENLFVEELGPTNSDIVEADYYSPILAGWIELNSEDRIWLLGADIIELPESLVFDSRQFLTTDTPSMPNVPPTETEENTEDKDEPPTVDLPENTTSETVETQKVPALEIPEFSVPEINITTHNPQAEARANPRIAMYAAGIAVLFLLFSATGNAATMLEEQESGTMDRILASKADLIHVIGGKWLGIFLLGIVQITVMFLWAELTYRIDLFQHLAGFFVMTLATSAATSSFAMALATLSKSRAQLNALSIVIILSMSALGGSMIPRFAMSDRMKEIGQWTFNAWALDGFQKVFWYDQPISHLREEVLVLGGSSLILLVVAVILAERWKKA